MTGRDRDTPAARPRRALDPRLLIGLVLVLVSVAGVVGIVRAADSSAPVYAASATLVPGQRIEASDLVRRDVVLDGADRMYLSATTAPDVGLVVTRTIARGELVPRAAIGRADDADRTSLVVTVTGRVSSAVVDGAEVDLWGAGSRTGTIDESVDPPTILVTGATVARIRDDDAGLVARGDAVLVELVIPKDRVARVLRAEADDQRMTVVPAGIDLGGAT